MQELWSEGAEYSLTTAEQPHEATFLKLDCSRARDQLGWKPVWTLGESLSLIVDWQRTYERQAVMREIALDTLARYETQAVKTMENA